jgi:hypothetical protein
MSCPQQGHLGLGDTMGAGFTGTVTFRINRTRFSFALAEEKGPSHPQAAAYVATLGDKFTPVGLSTTSLGQGWCRVFALAVELRCSEP